MKNPVPPILLAISLLQAAPLSACNLFDLVKPSLDDLREDAEQERLKEEARLQKVAEEKEAARLEEEARLEAIEAAKKDPLVDVETLKLAGNTAGKDVYTIESGYMLGSIAADRYGSSHYFPVIEEWNGISAEKVYVGQKVKTPSIATIMKIKGKNVLARYPDEVTAMLQLREDYLLLEPKLRDSSTNTSDEVKAKLEELHASAKKIHAGFLVKRPGVKEYASGLLAQCKNVVDQLGAMKNGDFGKKNSRISGVHLRLGYALRNAMVWGENDFQ